MDITFVFEPGKKRSCSPENPGLLFVPSDRGNGHVQERRMLDLRQHVMRTHLLRNRAKKVQAKKFPKCNRRRQNLHDLPTAGLAKSARSPVAQSTVSSTPDDEVDKYLGDPLATLGDSIGCLFENGHNSTTFLKWLAVGHDSTQAERFMHARTFYVRGLWEWASTQKLAFHALAFYVCRKRLELAGDSVFHRREYLQRKGILIEAIRQEIEQNGNDTGDEMALAMIALTSCLLLESNLRAGFSHLAALRHISPQKYSSSVCWVYMWLTDIRFALFNGSRPILEYTLHNIPDEFKRPCLQERPTTLGIRLAWLSPKAEPAFPSLQTEELFCKLLRFCTTVEHLDASSTLPLPELYDIEYKLRTVHARILDDPPSDTRVCTELTALAIQLSVWIAARMFSPLTARSTSTVTRRFNNLLESISPPELLQAWTNSAKADPISLLWTLALSSSCLVLDNDELTLLPALAHVTDHLSINTEREFISELRRWPPHNAWDGTLYSTTWSMLSSPKYQLESAESNSRAQRTHGGRHNSPAKRPFFGAYEFWDI